MDGDGIKETLKKGDTASPDEIARFAALAGSWWDPDGPFRPLHRLNPPRISFIRDHVARHHGRDPLAPSPLKGITILDIGCGGGLLCEPLSRLGARVVGIDAGSEAITVARAHGAAMGLTIDYRVGAPEAMVEGTYDAVLAMEVVEHVADLGAFLAATSAAVRPGGMFLASTINRTLKSLALAKLAAEYVLRWVPKGTHDWRKFVRPSELARGLRPHGLDVDDMRGMTHDPLSGDWFLSDDLEVNYLLAAVKG